MSFPFFPRLITGLGALAALAFASYWSARVGYADHIFLKDSPEMVSRAARLIPGNARYHARLADFLELSGKDPVPELETAVALNPRYSSALIRLGLHAERKIDFERAERYLLDAARMDSQFVPAWTLANYYFRRGDPERFWSWTRRALLMPSGDLSPLFRLCWNFSQDATAILERAIPNEAGIRSQYLQFLLAENRLDAAGPVAQQMVGDGSHRNLSDARVLLVYCDRLLDNRRVSEALSLWNSLCRAQFLPYAELLPERGLSITNADFGIAPLQQGFDWRVSSIPGISESRAESPSALNFIFSGKQPESCEILSQPLALLPARKYQYLWEYRTSNINPATGLRWKILDADTGADLVNQSPSLSHSGWTRDRIVFSTPARLKLARLALIYQRAPGTVRIEGSLSLRKVALELQ